MSDRYPQYDASDAIHDELRELLRRKKEDPASVTKEKLRSYQNGILSHQQVLQHDEFLDIVRLEELWFNIWTTEGLDDEEDEDYYRDLWPRQVWILLKSWSAWPVRVGPEQKPAYEIGKRWLDIPGFQMIAVLREAG